MELHQKLRGLLRGGASALTMAGLLGAASAFLYWLIIAHTSSVATLGRSATIVLAGSLINAVTSFGLTVGLLQQRAQERASRRSVALAVGISVVGSLLFALGASAVWPTSWLHEAGVTRLALMALLVEVAAGLAVSTLVDTVSVGYGASQVALSRNALLLIIRVSLALFATASLHGTTAVTQLFIAPVILSICVALPWLLWVTRTTIPWHHGPGEERAMLTTSMKSWPASLVFNAVTLGVPLSVSFIAGPVSGAVFYLLWNVGTLANSFVAALTSLGLGEIRRHSRREILKNIGLVGLAAGVGGEVALLTFGEAYFRAGWLASLVLGLALVPYGYLQFRVMFLRRAGNHLRASLGTLALLLVAELPLLLLRPQELVMAALIWLVATIIASLSVS